jgi:ABC-2 type transport system permease protein
MAWLTVWLAQILSLCRKEFLAVIKDPANRTILFVPVLMQSVLFGYGATFDLTNVPYVVVDESRSATSTALLARIDGTGVFRRAATLETPAQIAAMIDAGKATVAITIPSDFDQRLTRGQASPVEIVLDGRNSSTAGAAAGQIGTIVADFNRSGCPSGRHGRTAGVVQSQPPHAMVAAADADRLAQFHADAADRGPLGRA